MGRFILKPRCCRPLLVLLVMSFVIYNLIGLMPGDPIDIMIASNPGATPEVVAELRNDLRPRSAADAIATATGCGPRCTAISAIRACIPSRCWRCWCRRCGRPAG